MIGHGGGGGGGGRERENAVKKLKNKTSYKPIRN